MWQGAFRCPRLEFINVLLKQRPNETVLIAADSLHAMKTEQSDF